MKELLINILTRFGIEPTKWVIMLAVLGFIIVVSIIIHLLLHYVVLATLKRYCQRHPRNWLNVLINSNIFSRLALVLQGVIVHYQVVLWMDASSPVYEGLMVAIQLWILFYAMLSTISFLNVVQRLLEKSKAAANLPLNGIFQSIRLIAIAVFIILIVSALVGRSPAILFSGLSAMTAVLMLVFKDPIMGLAAGFQLTGNKMLAVGDWLEMPKYGADGEVTDISLTTVKVQNWDKTITTIPTYALISDSFKNWRGMSESGGRRIKRSIAIDTTSVHFLTDEQCTRLEKAHLLTDYLRNKVVEVRQHNESLGIDTSDPTNGRHLTNLGTFRAYLESYLKTHPHIHKEMTIMVRQMAPTSEGLPLEVYAFTNTTEWLKYESIQSDIFDYIYAILPEFDLRVHQTPTGNDLRHIGIKH